MKYIFDIIFVVILVLSTYIGIKKGFVKMFFGVVSFALSLYIAFALSTPVATFLQEKVFAPKIESSIAKSITEKSNDFTGSIPDFIIKNSEKFNLDMQKIRESVDTAVSTNADKTASEIVQNSINPVMIKIISAVTLIVLFIVLSLILGIIVKALNLIIKKSFAKGLNCSLGAVLGLINGIIIVCFICVIIYAVLTFNKDGVLIFNEKNAENSVIYNYLIEKIFSFV